MVVRSLSLLACLAAVVVACASPAGSGVPPSTNLITRAELDAAGTATVYDAVARLRPSYLRDRGPISIVNASARRVAVVFVDGSEYGELSSLERFTSSRVEEVRFYSGPEATTKFGSAYGAGVIALKMRVR